MKVYISIPITGKDIDEQKRHAEDVASFLTNDRAHASQSVRQRA